MSVGEVPAATEPDVLVDRFEMEFLTGSQREVLCRVVQTRDPATELPSPSDSRSCPSSSGGTLTVARLTPECGVVGPTCICDWQNAFQ